MIALNKILVATDFSSCSETAVTYGRELAAAFGSSVHLLHVILSPYAEGWSAETYSAPRGNILERWEREAKVRLEASVPAAEHGRMVFVTRIGTPYQAIVDYARDERVDLVIIGTHGRGPLGHLLIGSVAERVVRKAPCPVLTVHHPEHEFVAA
jgi:nucleotide-binding universal stress UspA family protein